MSIPAMMSETGLAHELAREDEFVTIVAPTIGGVMQQFRDSELGAKGYYIAGRVVRRAFKYADGSQNVDMFDGAEMVAATFTRQRG